MTIELKIKAFVAVIGLLGLLVGIFKFINIQEIEAAKPYLEKKLQWCEEVVEVAASLAVSPNDELEQRFLEMYWGVLGMVERQSIIDSMINFKEALDSGSVSGGKAIRIAHACREELSNDWSPKWSK